MTYPLSFVFVSIIILFFRFVNLFFKLRLEPRPNIPLDLAAAKVVEYLVPRAGVQTQLYLVKTDSPKRLASAAYATTELADRVLLARDEKQRKRTRDLLKPLSRMERIYRAKHPDVAAKSKKIAAERISFVAIDLRRIA